MWWNAPDLQRWYKSLTHIRMPSCEALACHEGDAELKVDIQERIVGHTKAKYEDITIKKLINISTCLDTTFHRTEGGVTFRMTEDCGRIKEK